MTSRLAALDREYYRRMAWTIPTATAMVAAGFYASPQVDFITPTRMIVGQQGPLRVLPQIDIIPEEIEDSHLTAAPLASLPSDFIAIEIDYAVVESAPKRPEPSPPTKEKIEMEHLFSDLDDLQDALRTTAHPVLAQSDYQLIYMQRPIYPSMAVQLGIEGDVDIMMLVDGRGRVARAYVLNPERYPLLEQAAKEAVLHCLFRPYIRDGKTIPFWIRVPFEFRLIN